MAVAQGQCPSCGAPMTFGVGASHSQVCKYCRSVVVRTDRDWQNLGKAADLANTPSTLAVGDRGTFRNRSFEVVGRVQLDYGRGPWDEFYVQYNDGQWGWIAEAQGNLYVTQKIEENLPLPQPQVLMVEAPVSLGRYGNFKVVERRDARMLTAEGELPFKPSAKRFYADCHGPNGAFATLDYNDGTKAPELFVGMIIPMSEIALKPRGGERPGAVKTAMTELTCQNCGGKLPAPKAGIERVSCRHCNTISDSSTMQVLARQGVARQRPVFQLGTEGTLGGTKYMVIGYVERSAYVEGEQFFWQEYLLWSQTVGFRWLMLDEGNWLFVNPISSADVQCNEYQAVWHGRTFQLRNRNDARVEYVLGEFYWKVEVGETVAATDFVAGNDVLSREKTRDEVSWSYCTAVSFAQLAQAFGVNPNAMATGFAYNPTPSYSSSGDASGAFGGFTTVAIVVCAIACIICIAASSDGSGGSSYSSGGSSYSGGGSSFGGFGGK
jgi:uncharacterized membrane protein YgcG